MRLITPSSYSRRSESLPEVFSRLYLYGYDFGAFRYKIKSILVALFTISYRFPLRNPLEKQNSLIFFH
jgi:hypothetical protein